MSFGLRALWAPLNSPVTDWAAVAEHMPKFLQAECERFGIEAVWAASLETIGYPPTWVTTWKEAGQILEHLEG